MDQSTKGVDWREGRGGSPADIIGGRQRHTLRIVLCVGLQALLNFSFFFWVFFLFFCFFENFVTSSCFAFEGILIAAIFFLWVFEKRMAIFFFEFLSKDDCFYFIFLFTSLPSTSTL